MSTFSHSRISSFEQCPKKYECCYVTKVPRGPGGIEAFMGSRVHEALEWLYGEVRVARLPSADDLLARYDEVWAAGFSDSIVINREDRSAEDYKAVGEKALRDYHARHAPFDDGTTIGLELRIDAPLDDAGTRLLGYVDRLVKRPDGVWEVHDYKTSNTLLTQEKADCDRQLALYAYAVGVMYPEAREVELVWHYLAFDVEVRSSRSPEQLEALRDETVARIREIEAASEFPTRTSSLCDWCEYKRLCPAWRHQFEVESMSPSDAAGDDGVGLVDRYMSVSARVSELEAEKEALRGAIVERADRDGLDRVFGTGYSVKVWRYTNSQLPVRDDPRRADVEAILEEDGLADRFSRTDWFELCRAIGSGKVPSGTMERLAPYVTISEGAKLYPSKKRE